MYHGGGRALGPAELSSHWLSTHCTGPATMGTNELSVRCTCPSLTPLLHSLSLISSFSHSLLPMHNFAFSSMSHKPWCHHFQKPSLFLLEEVGLMKPSWGQIIGWVGTVTAQNRLPHEHQSNRQNAQYWNYIKIASMTSAASQILFSHSSFSSIINIILFNKYS